MDFSIIFTSWPTEEQLASLANVTSVDAEIVLGACSSYRRHYGEKEALIILNDMAIALRNGASPVDLIVLALPHNYTFEYGSRVDNSDNQ